MSGRKFLAYALAAVLGGLLIVLFTPMFIVMAFNFASCNPRWLAQVEGADWTANATERTCFLSPTKTELALVTIRKGVVFWSPPVLAVEGSHRIKSVWRGNKVLEVHIPQNRKVHLRQTRFEDVSIVYK